MKKKIKIEYTRKQASQGMFSTHAVTDQTEYRKFSKGNVAKEARHQCGGTSLPHEQFSRNPELSKLFHHMLSKGVAVVAVEIVSIVFLNIITSDFRHTLMGSFVG